MVEGEDSSRVAWMSLWFGSGLEERDLQGCEGHLGKNGALLRLGRSAGMQGCVPVLCCWWDAQGGNAFSTAPLQP